MREPKFYRLFDYNKNLLPNFFVASQEVAVTSTEDARKNTGATIGYPGWGFIYYLLMSHLNPDKYNVILETGTNRGFTSIILAQALKDTGRPGHVFTIELEQENYEQAVENLKKGSVFDQVSVFRGDVRNVLPDVISLFDEICVAFLDASHMYDDVIFEFETILPKLRKHSIVLFDNTYQIAEANEDQRVNGALRYIHTTHGGNLINLEYVSWYTPGLAMWQMSPFNDVHEND